ncbi:MAG: energy-coupling factor ABC transporter ATP-binding protein [Candidatus Nezhaarchaeota archaeon]|nr:energy-coupling factor ABC transporter ATP-binding protein [Candidatus Nezhaarchaeota archaeon]MCX8141599.1 energy-coupling factor ABC transporter ATP-binding protein [Candidatus Nezhaarchaeota archaeon]MDW8049866.1 ABC transporter ATP-binding protein [Nitrososphaerota archaeon]
MIAVENLTVAYGDVIVLKDVSFTLNSGVHVLLGRNGSGKSTLLKTIAGLVRPSKGNVFALSREVHKLPRREAVKLIGYVWQNPYAGFVEATVKEELELSSKLVGAKLNYEIIDILVSKRLLDRNPLNLSGGEAKRVALAMVLALDQPIWLLDEPFEYLDISGIEAVVKVINYGLSKGKLVLIASAHTSYLHMLKLDQSLILSDGRIVFKGPANIVDEDMLKRFEVPSRAMICGPSN